MTQSSKIIALIGDVQSIEYVDTTFSRYVNYPDCSITIQCSSILFDEEKQRYSANLADGRGGMNTIFLNAMYYSPIYKGDTFL